ncbi:MAG: hypothetical protein ABIA97_00305 [Candidatus Omnitrophota bacterium]
MTDVLIIDVLLIFIRFMLPVIGVLSLVLFLRPKLFMDLEKKLCKEYGSKKFVKKTIAVLEKENLSLQTALQKNNQLVGLLCFILIVVIVVKLYF